MGGSKAVNRCDSCARPPLHPQNSASESEVQRGAEWRTLKPLPWPLGCADESKLRTGIR